MKKFLVAGGAAAVAAIGFTLTTTTGTSQQAETPAPTESAPIVSVTLPETLSPEAERGRQAFDAVCAACHGTNGAGKDGFGPPLIHVIYEPNHHGDMAFVMAVQNGVRAHHWPFGNMPPQAGLTQADIAGIIAYVRELQRANGIE